jgi:hypothetical protein
VDQTKCAYCGKIKRISDMRCEACALIHRRIERAQYCDIAAAQERVRMDRELAEIRRRNAEATLDKKPTPSQGPGAIREVSLERPTRRTLRKSDEED